MLIAPIFKVDYLSKQNEPRNSKIKDVSSNVQINNPASTSTYSNIFKTALNRGTELIKSTFLSKSTNCYNDSFELSTNVSQVSSQPAKLKTSSAAIERSSSESSISSSSSSSDHSSSPDSIKTELMLFKPIVREPRTSSSTKILRLPSIRSTSSSSTIHTPSPSPFFIPITSQRQSAFSVVIHSMNDTVSQKEIKKPKNVKRKNSYRENEKSEDKSPKRKKMDMKKVDKDSSYNTRLKTDKVIKEIKETRSTAKTIKNQSAATKVLTTKVTQKGRDNNLKTNEFRRVTRSMKKI